MSDEDKLRAMGERALMGRYEAEGMDVVDCVEGDTPISTTSEFMARTVAMAMNEADRRAKRKTEEPRNG